MRPVIDYDATAAEFYDVSATGAGWEDDLALPPEALSGFDPDAGPIVDIGAGTGLSTVTLADALPAARIVAVEPSTSMRAVLLSRIMARPELRDRITVLPGTFESEYLPDRWGGATARGMLGHLPPAHRESLWALVARRLAPGAHVVLDAVGERLSPSGHFEIYRSSTTQGEVTYDVVIERDVADDGEPVNRVTSVARHRPSGRVISRHLHLNPVFLLDRRMLGAELERVGLAARHVGNLCLVGRP